MSALPVDTAMFGMLAYCPSDRFLGSVILPASVDAHCAIDGMVISLRHLPICTTSGMFCPSGTPVSVNLPFVSVTAYAIGSPEKSAPHEHELVPTPMGMESSFPPCALAGTAGSSTRCSLPWGSVRSRRSRRSSGRRPAPRSRRRRRSWTWSRRSCRSRPAPAGRSPRSTGCYRSSRRPAAPTQGARRTRHETKTGALLRAVGGAPLTCPVPTAIRHAKTPCDAGGTAPRTDYSSGRRRETPPASETTSPVRSAGRFSVTCDCDWLGHTSKPGPTGMPDATRRRTFAGS